MAMDNMRVWQFWVRCEMLDRIKRDVIIKRFIILRLTRLNFCKWKISFIKKYRRLMMISFEVKS